VGGHLRRGDVHRRIAALCEVEKHGSRGAQAFEKLCAEVVPNSAEEFTRRQRDYARRVRIREQTGIKID
jgi:hypothetical protein